MSRIAVVTALRTAGLQRAVDAVVDHLRRCGLSVTTDAGDADLTLVWADHALASDVVAALQRGNQRVLLAGPTLAANDEAFSDAAGLVLGPSTPVHEMRLRPGPAGAEMAARFDGPVVATDRWTQVDKTLDDVEVLLTAMTGLAEHPVATWRPSTGVGVFSVGSTPATLTDPAYLRCVHRWVRHALGVRDGRPVRIGLLGYGAIGAEHTAAITEVDGLALAGVCDRNPARVDAARVVVPDLAVYADGDELVEADDVDLVVVSTPPNTHVDWTLRALRAGKHVVVEKPFCLTTAEADEMVDAAAAGDRVLAVYQNRRWDADYLALKRLVRDGAIGDVFHYESFVGGYGHPCNYWHSDEEVSGGAIYDWGSHYLDWVLDLFPGDVEHVTAAAHKRVWHDVTNADHSRVTVRFVDGVEAEFVHSDLAAAMKPKWYVLGERGAIVGHWRNERVVSRDAIGNLAEDALAAAESPAVLTVHAADGSVSTAAIGPALSAPFHRELADLLLSGAPMSVTAAGSRRNIAVMEAASISARDGGRPVVPR